MHKDLPKNTLCFAIFSFQSYSTNVKLALGIDFTLNIMVGLLVIHGTNAPSIGTVSSIPSAKSVIILTL